MLKKRYKILGLVLVFICNLGAMEYQPEKMETAEQKINYAELLKKLPKDLFNVVVLEFMTLRDISNLRKTSKEFRDLIDQEPLKSKIIEKRKKALENLQKELEEEKFTDVDVTENIDNASEGNYTALMQVIVRGNLDLVKAFIDNNADINIRDDSKLALTYALQEDSLNRDLKGRPRFNKPYREIIQLLIDKGAIVTQKDILVSELGNVKIPKKADVPTKEKVHVKTPEELEEEEQNKGLFIFD